MLSFSLLFLKSFIIRSLSKIIWASGWLVLRRIVCWNSLLVSEYFGGFWVFFVTIFHDSIRVLHSVLVNHFKVNFWYTIIIIKFINFYFNNIWGLKFMFGRISFLWYLINDIVIHGIPDIIRNVGVRKYDVNFRLSVVALIIFTWHFFTACW